MADRATDPRADDDQLLIRTILENGSPAAARALVERYTPQVLPIVQRILATDRTQAEDVVQEAWVRAFAQLSSFRHDGPFPAWLTRIAIRGAYDHLRRSLGRHFVEFNDTFADVSAADLDHDLRLDLERLIARLPPGCRAVLVLHDIEGFTHEEIHADLNIAVGTSKAHLFRARSLLKRWLLKHAQEVPAT